MSLAESIAHQVIAQIASRNAAFEPLIGSLQSDREMSTLGDTPQMLYELDCGPFSHRLWRQYHGNTKLDWSRFLGPRLIWESKPTDFPRCTTAIVSSQTGRNHSIEPHWMAALHDAMCVIHRRGDAILQSPSSPVGSQILFAASRLGIPSMVLHLPSSNQSLLDWIVERIESSNQKFRPRFKASNAAIHLSPLIERSDLGDRSDFPLVDRALIMLSDRVHAIRLRRGGKVVQLLKQRLEAHSDNGIDVLVSLCKQQVESNIAAKALMSDGAVGRYCEVDAGALLKGQSTIQSLFTVRDCLAPVITTRDWLHKNEWRFLTHCTRSRTGNWPDQSVEQFSDEWLLSEGIEQFGPIASLIRILTQQRLLATTHLKRSPRETVSFSGVPLLKLLDKRHFQSHLGRWDWEPFGICIRRDYLEARGAREVMYLPHSVYDELDESEQAYFQPASSESEGRTNWQEEQEWRIVGDLRLNAIPAEAAFAFVPNAHTAHLLAPISRWPIAVVRAEKD